MDSVESFTDIEKYWLSVRDDCDKFLLTIQDDKRELYFMSAFSRFLELSIKYGNLREPDGDVFRCKRLVKIRGNIPSAMLDMDGYTYVLFEGIHIVQDVVFIKSSLCREIVRRGKEIIKVPSEILEANNDIILSSVKPFQFPSGKEYDIYLVRSGFTNRYGINYSSSWEYQYFGYDKDIKRFDHSQ